MRRGKGRVREGIIDNGEACHLAEWEQEQPLSVPISTCAPVPPDQILGFNPAVPITIAALVIAVVDSTITVEDPFPPAFSKLEARRTILIARKS